MTRAETILDLRRRYAQAVCDRKHKLASIIYARLSGLMRHQLNYENKQDRRAA